MEFDLDTYPKTPITQRQHDNLLEGQVMWATVPEANVYHDLARWRKNLNEERAAPPTCDTQACFGGWCAWWPAFRAQGVHVDFQGMPMLRRGRGQNERLYQGVDVSSQLFGVSWLFHARGAESIFDQHIIKMYRYEHGHHPTDHELVKRRIELALALTVVE